MMKKFFIFIFTMFGLMVGVFALVLSNVYYRAYENFHNHSGNSSQSNLSCKYSSSSSGTNMIIKSNTNYEQILLQVHSMKIYPDNLIPYVKEARSMLKYFTYSICKESLMRRYKLSEDDAQYAVNKLDIDWKSKRF